MTDALTYIGILFAAIVGAFYAGKRKKGQEVETDDNNKRIATEARIRGAMADSDADWRDSLQRRK
jgi:hypothetical protein